MAVDKNQAIIEYLSTCPIVQSNLLFFNFAEESDNSNQIVIHSDEVGSDRVYVDGSADKHYTFTLYIYKSVTFNPVVKLAGYTDENVADLGDVQALIDWINTQNDNKVFPNFGNSCIIESVETLSNKPKLNGVDKNTQPPLAQYSITVKITYLDKSKMIWS